MMAKRALSFFFILLYLFFLSKANVYAIDVQKEVIQCCSSEDSDNCCQQNEDNGGCETRGCCEIFHNQQPQSISSSTTHQNFIVKKIAVSVRTNIQQGIIPVEIAYFYLNNQARQRSSFKYYKLPNWLEHYPSFLSIWRC